MQNNRIRIMLSVETDVYSSCYAETGILPSEWKDYLQDYVHTALKKRFGASINGRRYTVETRWNDDNENSASDNDMSDCDNDADSTPDTDLMVLVDELMAAAWHELINGARN